MAATSDEEMDSLLSGFDQIYQVLSTFKFVFRSFIFVTIHLRLDSGKWERNIRKISVAYISNSKIN